MKVEKQRYPVPTVVNIHDARAWKYHKETQEKLNEARAKQGLPTVPPLSLGEYLRRFCSAYKIQD